jgi:Fe-S-cluster containining protein
MSRARTQEPAATSSEQEAAGLGEQMRREVAGGLLYCHHRENTNTAQALEVTAFAYAVIDLLIEKGLLSEDELNERKLKLGKSLVEKFNERGMNVAIQESDVDKYKFAGAPQIDCESRVHLCKAACCRLKFPLSKQDLEEGIVKWDLPRPYLIARRDDGYCTHLEQGGHRCTVYENRPLPCRAYDCRQDTRIWADFENMLVSPDLGKLFET